jgi:processive 1,2-diacylglycerol beta-glucosyltransferase
MLLELILAANEGRRNSRSLLDIYSAFERVKSKILILSASFGDGHNSAARNIAEALEGQADARMADPCDLGNPRINRFLCRTYREITTYTPRIWAWLYRSTDRQDFSKPLPFIAKTEIAVADLLDDFQPDVVVNTYPLYPYMVDRQFQNRRRVPVITVITDSIEINAAWSRSPSDHFLITDDHTRESLVTQGIPAEKIHVMGFPVSPRFEALPKISPTDSLDPFRVLFFPTAKSPHVSDIICAVLADSSTTITVVLGRNVRRLYRKTHALKKEFPGRIAIKGWTHRVPELLSSHHLVIGKAGGATVHEAIAAQCPMLVHHIVPGQEEGNIELLERYQTGSLATSAKAISDSLSSLLDDDACLWRDQKSRLAIHAKPTASRDTANFILSQIPSS